MHPSNDESPNTFRESSEESSREIMMPELPDYGAYLRWPEPGEAWIHEEDQARARAWIPSNRVFKRFLFDGTYYHLRYGLDVIRVLPSMWTRVPSEDMEVGDQVEVLANFGNNVAGIGTVSEKTFRTVDGKIVYWVRQREFVVPNPYMLDDLHRITTRCELKPPSFQHPVPKYHPAEPGWDILPE